MTDNVAIRPLTRTMPLGLQVTVLAALSAGGTLATNILLPSLPGIAMAVGVSSAQVTSAITVFLAMFAVGQLIVGPVSDRFGRRMPVMIGFAVFFVGSVWCALANDLPTLLTGRVVQAAGACATSVLSRAIARDLFEGDKLARVLTFVMIAMAAAPGFSPLVGGALDHYFGWRSAFAFVAIIAAIAAIGYSFVFGETHHSTRTALDPVSIFKSYWSLSTDRRFVIPAATVSLILGALFAMFSALPRVLIEGLDSSLRDVKQDDSNNEVAPSRGGEQIDDVLDGLVGAVVGGFESAVWAMLRVRTVVEAAVGKWSAQPFVEEQK